MQLKFKQDWGTLHVQQSELQLDASKYLVDKGSSLRVISFWLEMLKMFTQLLNFNEIIALALNITNAEFTK